MPCQNFTIHLAVCRAGSLLRLLVQTVESVDGVVVQLTVDLALQLGGEPRAEPHPRPLGEVPLNKHFPAVSLGKCGGGGVCHSTLGTGAHY